MKKRLLEVLVSFSIIIIFIYITIYFIIRPQFDYLFNNTTLFLIFIIIISIFPIYWFMHDAPIFSIRRITNRSYLNAALLSTTTVIMISFVFRYCNELNYILGVLFGILIFTIMIDCTSSSPSKK